MSTLKTNRIEPVGSTAGTVTVDGTMVFTQGATFPGGISVGQAAYFSNGITVAGGISVSGNATFSGTVFMGKSAAPFYGPTGNAPIYGIRAWACFNGGAVSTSPGSMAGVCASGNISSVMRINTGVYWVSFATPMQNTEYSTTVTACEPIAYSDGRAANVGIVYGISPTGVTIGSGDNSSDTLINVTRINFIVVG